MGLKFATLRPLLLENWKGTCTQQRYLYLKQSSKKKQRIEGNWAIARDIKMIQWIMEIWFIVFSNKLSTKNLSREGLPI